MYPVLLRVGAFRVESYYALWGVAVCLMVLWTRRRAVRRYGISYNDATDVLLWVLVGVLIGATLGGYLDHWKRYAADPARILRFWESGLSSGPGFLGGGIAGLWKLSRLRVSPDAFAESAAVPCAFLLFVGRWGCFLNGCCAGIPTSSPFGVTFPGGAATPVYPSQIFESLAGLVIGLLLSALEAKWKRSAARAAQGALLWPLFLILYGAYRLVFDFLRAGDRIFGLRVGQYSGLLALAVGVGWLLYSRKRLSAQRVPEAAPAAENVDA